MTFSFRPAKSINAAQELYPILAAPNYAVDEYGTVVNLRTKKLMRPAPRSKAGYLGIALWDGKRGHTWFIHQLVAVAFYGPRPSPDHQAAHRDGNKLNNHKSNIRWCTRAENEADKVLHGTSNRGDRNGMSRAARKKRGEI